MPPSSLLRTLFLLLAVAGSAIAELTFVATARQGDREIPSSELKFIRTTPRPRHPNLHGGPGQTETGTGELGKRDITAYGPSWCGASQQLAAPEQLSSVYGIFNVPKLKLRAGLSAPQNAAAWGGVDGDSCNRALLQVGVTTLINSNGRQITEAWWQWWPSASYSIPSIPTAPGDWMAVNITMTSSTSASMYVHPTRIHINVMAAMALCRTNATWIFEDYYDRAGSNNMADFNDVWFEYTTATTVGGTKLGVDGGVFWNMQNSTGQLKCTAQKYDNSNFFVRSVM
ncbi:peptidase A4 family-domain-containing protein [Pseudoneurospora amorphoporcata]|uniref:Peptidase A4 family-domain-containing protein n=1 Tax=Pseudoneurospora amorphoporcata TaxID=241081 RepID=A0AAN6NTA3_9PEZI|nr:peptidase A4 family-domain-containing protein [Pseudoneurospora amorphoporcata]